MLRHSVTQSSAKNDNLNHSTLFTPAPQKRKKWYKYGIIYRVLYWCLVMLFLLLILVALHFGLKVEFGQCSAYDIKCS